MNSPTSGTTRMKTSQNNLPTNPEIAAADDADGDDQPDEDPHDERDGGKPRTEGVRKRRHAVGSLPGEERLSQSTTPGPYEVVAALAARRLMVKWRWARGGSSNGCSRISVRHSVLSSFRERPSATRRDREPVSRRSCSRRRARCSTGARSPSSASPAAWSTSSSAPCQSSLPDVRRVYVPPTICAPTSTEHTYDGRTKIRPT